QLLESAPFALCPPTMFSFLLPRLPATVSLLGFPVYRVHTGSMDSYQQFTGARCGAWCIFEPEHSGPPWKGSNAVSQYICSSSLSPNGATVCSHRTGRGKEHLAQSPALGRSPIS